jgi:hypothetical protein
MGMWRPWRRRGCGGLSDVKGEKTPRESRGLFFGTTVKIKWRRANDRTLRDATLLFPMTTSDQKEGGRGRPPYTVRMQGGQECPPHT